MIEKYSPVLVVGYNRPAHLGRCLKSLSFNSNFSKHPVFIYLDGPSNNQFLSVCEEALTVAQDFAKQNDNVKVFSNSNNFGLGKFVLFSIDNIFSFNDTIIVVEDDLVLSPYFLEFCSWGLKEYANDSSVGSISGFSLPIGFCKSSYFLRGAECWGWATWKDRWSDFERDGAILLQRLEERKLQRVFDLDYSYQYMHMLDRQVHGSTNSWAIRWHAHNFLRGRLALYPNDSLVINIGNDGSGTNMGLTNSYVSSLAEQRPRMERIIVNEDIIARQKLIEHYKKQFRQKLRDRFISGVRRKFYSDTFSL